MPIDKFTYIVYNISPFNTSPQPGESFQKWYTVNSLKIEIDVARKKAPENEGEITEK